MKSGTRETRRWTLSTATVRGLMEDMRTGDLAPDEVVARLRRLPHPDLGFALIDHQRALRHDLSEAVSAPDKTPETCAAIVAELLAGGAAPVVMSRASVRQAATVRENCPGSTSYPHGGVVTLVWRAMPTRDERVVLLTSDSSDKPVVDECAAVLQAHGLTPAPLTGVGLAGLPRLLAATDVLLEADTIVVAGPGGGLASVVGGLTAAPIVAVPTSVSASATALPAMLASYASGLAVVGLDDGFSAACAVIRLLGPPPNRN